MAKVKSNRRIPNDFVPLAKVMEEHVDDAIAQMRELTGFSDEQIYDEIMNTFPDMLDYERNLFAEKLGVS